MPTPGDTMQPFTAWLKLISSQHWQFTFQLRQHTAQSHWITVIIVFQCIYNSNYNANVHGSLRPNVKTCSQNLLRLYAHSHLMYSTLMMLSCTQPELSTGLLNCFLHSTLCWLSKQECGYDPNDHHNQEVEPHEAYVEQGRGTKRTDNRHCSAEGQPQHKEEESTHRNQRACGRQ